MGGLGRVVGLDCVCVPCGAENLLANFPSIRFCGCGYVRDVVGDSYGENMAVFVLISVG